MYILGISGGVRLGYHDIGAALLKDGKLVAAVEEEDDDAIEEIMNERFLFKPENHFSADKLIKAYGVPTTIAGFIYSVLGNKPLPTKRDLAQDTVGGGL